MLKSLVPVVAAFLGAVWAARHYGGQCSATPIYIAIFIYIVVLGIFLVHMYVIENQIAMIGVMFAFLMSIMLIAHLSTSAKILIDPTDTSGRVGTTEATITQLYEYAVARDRYYTPKPGSEGFETVYTYTVDGVDYEQCDVEARKDLQVGDHLKVFYLVDRPAIARLLRANELPAAGTAK